MQHLMLRRTRAYKRGSYESVNAKITSGDIYAEIAPGIRMKS